MFGLLVLRALDTRDRDAVSHLIDRDLTSALLSGELDWRQFSYIPDSNTALRSSRLLYVWKSELPTFCKFEIRLIVYRKEFFLGYDLRAS